MIVDVGGYVFDYMIDCSDKLNPKVISVVTGKTYTYKELYDFYINHIDEVEILDCQYLNEKCIRLLMILNEDISQQIYDAWESYKREKQTKNTESDVSILPVEEDKIRFLNEVLNITIDNIMTKYGEQIAFAKYFVTKYRLPDLCSHKRIKII